MAGYRRNSIAASLTSVGNRAGSMLLADSLPCFFNSNKEEEVQMTSNLAATKKVHELFKQGDISALVNDIVDATCAWVIPGPQDKLPRAGKFKGRQEIADFFARAAQNFDFAESAPARND